MNKKQIGGLAVAVLLFIITGAVSVLTNTISANIAADSVGEWLTGGYTFDSPMEDYIAIVNVTGTIEEQTDTGIFSAAEGYQHITTLEYIDYLMEDAYNVGILLYVDSPGGAVYESEELYQKLLEYKKVTERPVWDYMAHYAASGGYYVSALSDRIYANPNTVTGSIGVIMAGYDMTGLYEKLGIKYVSITSGKNKDSSQMTDEQIAIYQSQVDEAYEQFVKVVADGRKMSADQVKALADGRTYTAKQAVENGLVDEIARYEDVLDIMSEELGTDVYYELDNKDSIWASLFARAESLIPRSEAQVLAEIADDRERGGLMYYAEQLQ